MKLQEFIKLIAHDVSKDDQATIQYHIAHHNIDEIFLFYSIIWYKVHDWLTYRTIRAVRSAAIMISSYKICRRNNKEKVSKEKEGGQKANKREWKKQTNKQGTKMKKKNKRKKESKKQTNKQERRYKWIVESSIL